MMLIEQTPIADADLPVEAFKAHLRLGSGFGTGETQDAVLASFLRAAIAAVEGRTGKALLMRMFALTLGHWTTDCGQVLPVAPVSAKGSVVVHFEAGFAAAWEGVPSDLRQAVLMLAAHYYEYRHETRLGDGCMPFGVSSLIERYRPLRIGLGARA